MKDEFGNMASYGYPMMYICAYCGHMSYTLADAKWHTENCDKHPINSTCWTCVHCSQPCSYRERMPMWHCEHWEAKPVIITSIFSTKEIE